MTTLTPSRVAEMLASLDVPVLSRTSVPSDDEMRALIDVWEAARKAKTPQWTEGQPPWTDGDALLFQVDTNEGVQTFVGRVDEQGTMVDCDYGDGFGWESHSVDRWIKLDDLMETFANEELPPWKDEDAADKVGGGQ